MIIFLLTINILLGLSYTYAGMWILKDKDLQHFSHVVLDNTQRDSAQSGQRGMTQRCLGHRSAGLHAVPDSAYLMAQCCPRQ